MSRDDSETAWGIGLAMSIVAGIALFIGVVGMIADKIGYQQFLVAPEIYVIKSLLD